MKHTARLKIKKEKEMTSEIMGKKKKSNEVIFEEIMNDIQRATIKGKVIHGKRTAHLKIKVKK